MVCFNWHWRPIVQDNQRWISLIHDLHIWTPLTSEHLWIHCHHQNHHPSWANFLSGWPASFLDDLCSYSRWPASSLGDLCNYTHTGQLPLRMICATTHTGQFPGWFKGCMRQHRCHNQSVGTEANYSAEVLFSAHFLDKQVSWCILNCTHNCMYIKTQIC